jgi:hypothetical protein
LIGSRQRPIQAVLNIRFEGRRSVSVQSNKIRACGYKWQFVDLLRTNRQMTVDRGVPQRLKPPLIRGICGTAKAVPLRKNAKYTWFCILMKRRLLHRRPSIVHSGKRVHKNWPPAAHASIPNCPVLSMRDRCQLPEARLFHSPGKRRRQARQNRAKG